MSDYARRYLDLVQEDYLPYGGSSSMQLMSIDGQCALTDRTPLLYPNVKWDSRESLFYRKINKI